MPDLIIGEKAGNLNFYKNTGDIYDPVFTFVTDSLGKVNVTDPGISYYGYSTPYLFRAADGKMRLLSGSEQGIIYCFKNIEGNLGGAYEPDASLWKEIDSLDFDLRPGYRTSAAIADLNTDGYLDLAVGNWSGGLELYSTALQPPVTMDIDEASRGPVALNIFPNPSAGQISVSFENIRQDGLYLFTIYSATGIKVLESELSRKEVSHLNVGHLANSVYICTLRDKDLRIVGTARLIVVH